MNEMMQINSNKQKHTKIRKMTTKIDKNEKQKQQKKKITSKHKQKKTNKSKKLTKTTTKQTENRKKEKKTPAPLPVTPPTASLSRPHALSAWSSSLRRPLPGKAVIISIKSFFGFPPLVSR